jgi:pimeloyl-ACP methyl ester carboxylesterase
VAAAIVPKPAAGPSHLLTPDGVDIVMHDLGGSGPPLLLAHATGLHGLVWAPLASHLTKFYRCVAFDARGHGDSAVPPDGDFDWSRFASDILAVADSLGTEQPLGVGHSSGATAMLMAEETRPGTFGAIYCFEPIIVTAEPPLGRDRGNWLAASARRRRETFASREDAFAHFASKPPFQSWDRQALAAYVEHGFGDVGDGRVRLKCSRESEALSYEMATAHEGFARLSEVRCPVLLASGAETDAVGAASSAILADRLPNATTAELPGIGHFGPLEHPAAIAASVRSFFKALAAGDGTR